VMMNIICIKCIIVSQGRVINTSEILAELILFKPL